MSNKTLDSASSMIKLIRHSLRDNWLRHCPSLTFPRLQQHGVGHDILNLHCQKKDPVQSRYISLRRKKTRTVALLVVVMMRMMIGGEDGYDRREFGVGTLQVNCISPYLAVEPPTFPLAVDMYSLSPLLAFSAQQSFLSRALAYTVSSGGGGIILQPECNPAVSLSIWLPAFTIFAKPTAYNTQCIVYMYLKYYVPCEKIL